MALTSTQVRVLNEFSNYEPALRKGQLSAADQILLGDLLQSLSNAGVAAVAAVEVPAIAAVTATGTADGTYGAEEAAQINALIADVTAMRASLVAIRTLVNELRTNVNANA